AHGTQAAERSTGEAPAAQPGGGESVAAAHGGELTVMASLYAAGQRNTVPNLWACGPSTKQRCTSPFSVVRIDPVTLQTREVVRHPGGPTFGAASTALRIGDEYWFGTPHGDRIAIAPAN